MAVSMSRFLGAALCLGLAAAQSVSSCGSATDLLQNVQLTVSPDPPVQGKPFTVTVTGNLAQDVDDLKVAADLDISALGIISKTLKANLELTGPAVSGGATTVVVGPIQVPSVPGSLTIKGQTQLSNGQNQPITCIALNLKMPLLEQAQAAVATPAIEAPTACTTPSDHIQNIQVTKSDTSATITATLDEDLQKVNINAKLDVKVLVPIPINIDVPISFTPGFKKGDYKLVAQSGSPIPPSGGISVTGQVTAVDGNNQQLTCVNIDGSLLQQQVMV